MWANLFRERFAVFCSSANAPCDRAWLHRLSIGAEFGCLLPCEKQETGLMVQEFKVLVENVCPKQMDSFERTSVYEDSCTSIRMILQHMDELIGRHPVEITLELDMKIGTFL